MEKDKTVLSEEKDVKNPSDVEIEGDMSQDVSELVDNTGKFRKRDSEEEEEETASDDENAPRRRRNKKEMFKDMMVDMTDGEDIQKSVRTIKTNRDKYVINIEGERVLTDDSLKYRKEYIRLLDSENGGRNGKILTGKVVGKTSFQNMGTPITCAIVKTSPDSFFRIYIPITEFFPANEENADPKRAENGLTLRIGSEVDFIVKGIKENHGFALASRIDAMEKKRKYFLRDKVNREGDTRINKGDDVQARILLVAKSGVLIDTFGVESFVPLRELMYEYLLDAKERFMPGQSLDVRIMEKEIYDNGEIQVVCSRLPLVERVIERYIDSIEKGNTYEGVIVNILTKNVYVHTSEGFDILCGYPELKSGGGAPSVGDKVIVEVTEAKKNILRVFGRIERYRTKKNA